MIVGWQKIWQQFAPISVYWELQDDEQQAIAEGRHEKFQHDRAKWELQFTAPRIGSLTEEEAIEYLCMKDLPRRCWAEEHNRPMFKIVTVDQVPSDRTLPLLLMHGEMVA